VEPWNYQPAKDLDLAPLQRWASIRRESGLLEQITQGCWWGAVSSYLKIYHRLKASGAEHFPEKPPFVVVANHESHLDALILASALPRRQRRFVLPVAAGDTFFVSPLIAAFAAACLNALPLWRKNAGRHALQQLRERLISEPCAFILFPAGTRSRDGSFLSFKPGLGMMVAGTSAPVVPCFLEGAFETFPPGARWPRPRQITLTVGAPIDFSTVENTRAGWELIASRSERAVRDLAGPR
jgi:1-acyl-sn-glycerol-3-phosphate acyltransferase